MLAGIAMNTAGVTRRIYDFAECLAGWLRGGLAHVNVIGSVIFAGMSGSAVADAAGLRDHRDQGDGRRAAAGDFARHRDRGVGDGGPIVPSVPLLFYGSSPMPRSDASSWGASCRGS